MANLSMWIRSLLTRPQQTPVPLSWLNVTLPTSSLARRAAQPNSNAYGAPAACADRRDGLWDLERQLRPAMFQECLQMRAHRSVAILLPRFKINGETADIEKPLAELGLRLPFTPSQADFSGIDGRGPPDDDSLFIQRVLHKAFTEVNEQGTEAATSTMARLKCLSMPTSSPPPAAVFRADHPFLFAIIERHAGTILFFGRVANPTRQR